MKDLILKLCVKAQMVREEHGQDLIEYALIAVACVAGMKSLAAQIATEFANVSGNLT